METLRQLFFKPAMSGSRLATFLGLAVVVILLDQATKAGIRAWLPPGETWPDGWTVIRFSHVHNSGAAFGILQGQTSYLAVASVFAILAIVLFLATLPSHTRWYPLALSGILGGAIGNFIDRVRLGYVTDFIDPMRYPAFNLADSAIVLGVVLVGFLTLFGHEDPTGAPEVTGDGDERDAGRDARDAPQEARS
ncbi:MAG: signal peptidase II [Chloroflexi bacterium]|nr:signal peptidase II [Chloroflexota bacterium]